MGKAAPADANESPVALPRERWLSLLDADPRPLLLACGNISAVFLTRTKLLDEPEPACSSLRAAIVAEPAVAALVEGMQAWTGGLSFGGHASPAFPPARLRLLHLLGVRAGDFRAIDDSLDAMLDHQAADGRLLTPGKHDAPWTSLPCDHHAILEALLLFGRGSAPAVGRALARAAETFETTPQGPGWRCLPDPVAKWRGPGKKADVCLQASLESLRLFALAPDALRPRGLDGAARTVLAAWRNRKTEKPYMFGHGARFAAGKWPPTWYDASAVLEVLATRPAVWRGTGAADEDAEAVVEIATGLAANFDSAGLVTPRSTHRGFEAFDFGQKKRPSFWATARLCAVLRPFSPLFRDGR